MADIEVYEATTEGTRVASLRVKLKGAGERTIDRETALSWLAGGHSLITYAGPAHHGTRGHAIERVEVGDEAWLRTDTEQKAEDHLEFPHAH